MRGLRACCSSRQEKVRWSPDWMVVESQGQNGVSTLPMWWSHCRCGPLFVLIQVYADNAFLLNCMAVPSRKPCRLLSWARACFPLARRPPSVTVLVLPRVAPL